MRCRNDACPKDAYPHKKFCSANCLEIVRSRAITRKGKRVTGLETGLLTSKINPEPLRPSFEGVKNQESNTKESELEMLNRKNGINSFLQSGKEKTVTKCEQVTNDMNENSPFTDSKRLPWILEAERSTLLDSLNSSNKILTELMISCPKEDHEDILAVCELAKQATAIARLKLDLWKVSKHS